jgi:hypothetical protein
VTFQPRQVTRSYEQRWAAPPERILPLLTAVGEKAWAPGWEPEVLFQPPQGDAGTVFITRHAHPGKATLWRMEEMDLAARRVRYVHVTAGIEVTELEIVLTPEGADRTRARVTYTFTGLGEEGNRVVEQQTEASYASWMREWEAEMNHFLTTGQKHSGKHD